MFDWTEHAGTVEISGSHPCANAVDCSQHLFISCVRCVGLNGFLTWYHTFGIDGER